MNDDVEAFVWSRRHEMARELIVFGVSDLERVLQEIRTAANVTTRTTVVLSTPYEGRPPRVS